jgi:hypothetical protein
MTRTGNAGTFLALAALATLAPATADAWVAVRVGVAPRLVGAAAVGVAAGAVAGAAASSAYNYSAPPPSTVVVQAPPAPPAVGTVVTTLPSGCATVGNRYQCGAVWYQPYFGGNGVYYQVVAP